MMNQRRQCDGMVRAAAFVFGWVLTLVGCTDGELSLLGPRGNDEIWAIRTITTVGADHARSAEAYAEALRKVDGLRSRLVRIIHDSGASKVYYGRYLREYDIQTGNATFKPPHRDDLRVIRGLTLGAGGSRPFARALPELLPITSTHPEWDLAGQTNGHWSLHVAVFYNEGRMNQRRKAAEDYCAELRRQGEQAFFHHGPVKSSVCIGLFPESALETRTRTDARTGTPVSGTVYADPHLAALQRKYPNNLENGHIINRIVRDPVSQEIVRRTANESFVVRVPESLGGTFQP